jgi:hypothetical protein
VARGLAVVTTWRQMEDQVSSRHARMRSLGADGGCSCGIVVSGAGWVRVNASNPVDASTSDAGKVQYIGSLRPAIQSGPISGLHRGRRPNGRIQGPDTCLHPNASRRVRLLLRRTLVLGPRCSWCLGSAPMPEAAVRAAACAKRRDRTLKIKHPL